MEDGGREGRREEGRGDVPALTFAACASHKNHPCRNPLFRRREGGHIHRTHTRDEGREGGREGRRTYQG